MWHTLFCAVKKPTKICWVYNVVYASICTTLYALIYTTLYTTLYALIYTTLYTTLYVLIYTVDSPVTAHGQKKSPAPGRISQKGGNFKFKFKIQI